MYAYFQQYVSAGIHFSHEGVYVKTTQTVGRVDSEFLLSEYSSADEHISTGKIYFQPSEKR